MGKNNSPGKPATTILGIMSGTSLDGTDLALCSFTGGKKGLAFSIIKGVTVPYPAIWKQRLTSISSASAEKYFALDAMYGQYIATLVNGFLKNVGQRPHAIASHGHTVFHQPHAGFSTQIGSGATIAAHTGITTVCDFRSTDVAMGGQGAPLVPIGDQLLFSDYEACLNIGGIANISYEKKGKRVAYDICPANMLLNYLAESLGADYDKDGGFARKGKVQKQLLEKLDGLDYYKVTGAKSTGREWFEQKVVPLFDNSRADIYDQIATATQHVAAMIAEEIKRIKVRNVLVTGGGAFNSYLVSLIKSGCPAEIVIPSDDLVNFKEALIFAFLGYLRLNGKVNTLSSVTGVKNDSVGGAVYAGSAG